MRNKTAKSQLNEITDVFDFFKRWADIRTIAVDASKNRKLTNSERATIYWLITLTDRISERDINHK